MSSVTPYTISLPRINDGVPNQKKTIEFLSTLLKDVPLPSGERVAEFLAGVTWKIGTLRLTDPPPKSILSVLNVSQCFALKSVGTVLECEFCPGKSIYAINSTCTQLLSQITSSLLCGCSTEPHCVQREFPSCCRIWKRCCRKPAVTMPCRLYGISLVNSRRSSAESPLSSTCRPLLSICTLKVGKFGTF